MNLERPSVSGVLAHGLAVFVGPRLTYQARRDVEGAIEVSGAPTGKQDEDCARRGIEAIG